MMLIFISGSIAAMILGAASLLCCIPLGALAIVCPDKYRDFAERCPRTPLRPGTARDFTDRFLSRHARAFGAIVLGVGLPVAFAFCYSATSLCLTVFTNSSL